MPVRALTRRFLRARKFLIASFLLLNLLDVLYVRRNLQQAHYDLSYKHERIFIASTHWNDEVILRTHWMTALLQLTKALDPLHVYLSIYESGSYDNTKGALRELDAAMEAAGVFRTVVLDEATHEGEIVKVPPTEEEGWIRMPNGTLGLRRIPYLSRSRNQSLKPFYKLAAAGQKFDKILFLNDVVFTTQDVLALLNTNGGNYAAACSLDFSKPPRFYDTFALRDAEGHEPLMQTWPYFRSRASRKALKAHEPVPVSSCWNGMVMMDAAPFYEENNALRFRGIPDSLAKAHLEASECCLIHTDNHLSRSKGVFVNPSVRVGYNGLAWTYVQPAAWDQWLNPVRIVLNSWENRIRRWTTTTWIKESAMRRKVSAWASEKKGRAESGSVCLINEMQILTWYGWAHV